MNWDRPRVGVVKAISRTVGTCPLNSSRPGKGSTPVPTGAGLTPTPTSTQSMAVLSVHDIVTVAAPASVDPAPSSDAKVAFHRCVWPAPTVSVRANCASVSMTISPVTDATLTDGAVLLPVALAWVPVSEAVVWCAPVNETAPHTASTAALKLTTTLFAPVAGLDSFHCWARSSLRLRALPILVIAVPA